MAFVRRILMWAALAAIGLLVVLSIVGAFIGAESARAMFNSPPLAVFWIFLAALIVAGFFAFKRLLRSPGLLVLHLGGVLIFGGSMYGSDAGHASAEKLFGIEKVPRGLIKIHEGERTCIIHDEDATQLGKLPFEIGLKKFWIEYYEEPGPWNLFIDAPAGRENLRLSWKLTWERGKELDLPFVSARLKVLRYLPGARSVEGQDPLADPNSELPAMEVLLTSGQRQVRGWLMPEAPDRPVRLDLTPLAGPATQENDDGDASSRIYLIMQEPRGQIRDYKSTLVVYEQGREKLEKTIEVNDPLHYGGYHFYQQDFDDSNDGKVTELAVKSDSGLSAVYAGLILLSAGTFWACWIGPAWGRLTRHGEGKHGC